LTDLVRIREGDRSVIESIYKECFPSISNWVKKNSGTEKEAEDVFQDALIVVYQKSKEEGFQLSCKLSTFVFSVAKKIWLYRLRSKGRLVHTDADFSDIAEFENQSADELMIQAEVENIYKKGFEKLSEECRTILTNFFNGLSMRQIMDKLGLANESVVRKKKFRCKNELVKLVEKDPMYQELVNRDDV